MRLLYLTSAWIGGLLLGLLTHPALWLLLILLFALLPIGLLALILGRRSAGSWEGMKLRRPLILIVATLISSIFILGLIRSGATESPPPLPYEGPGQPVTVEGIVAGPPEARGNSLRFVLRARSIDEGNGWKELATDILVMVRPTPDLVALHRDPFIRYGDRLTLRGTLEEPPVLETFDYRDYLARQGIHLVMDFPTVELQEEGLGSPALTSVYDFRDSMSRSLERALPEPQAAVAQTLLLGKRDNLSPELRESFRTTGASHLLAISGLHVGVVLVLTMAGSAFLLGRKGPYFLLIPLAALWGYAVLSGMSPSVLRAAIMGTIYLAAVANGRPRNVFPALALAAAVMAGFDPRILQDLSFQLSFAAVAGIALLAPPLTDWLQDKLRLTQEHQGFALSLARGALLSGVVSVAATLATLPLVAFHFHQMPTLGIPATVLALPALPPILLTAALTVAADAVHPTLGQVTGWASYVPITYLTTLIQGFAAIPGGLIEVPRFSGLLVWLYYLPLILAVLAPWPVLNMIGRKSSSFLAQLHIRPRTTNLRLLLPTAALFLLAAVTWAQALSSPDGKLRVIFLDVDQGDGILIISPAGQRVHVDGGPDPVNAVSVLNAHLPFWNRSLDLLVSTHTDEDHLAGLVGVVQRHPVDTVVEGISGTSPLYLRWRQALEDKSIQPQPVYRGASINLGDGLTMEVLNPPLQSVQLPDRDANNSSVVLRLTYGEISFLLTGDIEEQAELELIREEHPLESTVLKVSHHGSRHSSGPFFLRAVNPTVAVIQSGEDNRFGHPHEEVIDRLQKVVGEDGLYVTSLHGDVELTTDGHSLWLKTKK